MYEGQVNVSQTRLHTFMKLAEALQVRGLTDTQNTRARIEKVGVVTLTLYKVSCWIFFFFFFFFNTEFYDGKRMIEKSMYLFIEFFFFLNT